MIDKIKATKAFFSCFTFLTCYRRGCGTAKGDVTLDADFERNIVARKVDTCNNNNQFVATTL